MNRQSPPNSAAGKSGPPGPSNTAGTPPRVRSAATGSAPGAAPQVAGFGAEAAPGANHCAAAGAGPRAGTKAGAKASAKAGMSAGAGAGAGPHTASPPFDGARPSSPAGSAPADFFPPTTSIIGRLVSQGTVEALAEAVRKVMHIYLQPLAVFFRGSSFSRDRWAREFTAEDVVAGFFADRLSRPNHKYLTDWLVSRRPLRYWLIVGFKHYCYEQRDEWNRTQKERAPETYAHTRPVDEASMRDPERDFHRRFALHLVQDAVARTAESLEAEGHHVRWHIVLRHHLDERTYRELADELGVTEGQAKLMSMQAATRFRRTLNELATWPGASADDLRREIHDLLEALRR